MPIGDNIDDNIFREAEKRGIDIREETIVDDSKNSMKFSFYDSSSGHEEPFKQDYSAFEPETINTEVEKKLMFDSTQKRVHDMIKDPNEVHNYVAFPTHRFYDILLNSLKFCRERFVVHNYIFEMLAFTHSEILVSGT